MNHVSEGGEGDKNAKCSHDCYVYISHRVHINKTDTFKMNTIHFDCFKIDQRNSD